MKNKNIEEIFNNIDDTACLLGSCKIGNNTKILPYCVLENAIIGDNCTIGPHCHIHGNSEIGDNCRVGNYVEINRSKLHNGVKVAHLTYVGDAEILDNTNVGAGVVFCNFDGKDKHKTFVGKNTFIGSNSSLVAPITIGDNCMIGAGSVVTKNLENGAFYLSRPDNIIKPNKK